MELRENLELVNVEISDNKAELSFVDVEKDVLRVVQFNKNVWDEATRKYIPNDEKAAKVEEWCSTYFDTSFDNLSSAIGVHKNVYVYDNYCSLWETNEISKFKEDDLGLIDEATIQDITLDNVGIRIKLNYNGAEYESKMGYSKYLEHLKKYMIDPIKEKKQIENFKDKFGVSVEEKDKLVGQKIMFEVKKAMGKFIYVEIKKMNKKRK